MQILDEIASMFTKIDTQLKEQDADANRELDLCKLMDLAVGSVINSVIFGYRLEGVGNKQMDLDGQ